MSKLPIPFWSTIPADEILETEAVMTMVGGEVVFERKK